MTGRLEHNLEQSATEVASLLQAAGHQALFAGGCVRDRMLGLEPDDFDIATSASPEQVQAVFPRAHGVGEFFGVMLVHMNSWPIQVATFRTEGPYSDHRRPDHVSAATLEEDAARRDFTINGMYWDPVSAQLIDLHGGEQDLLDGVIRAIGEAHDRLQEDHLRMLRAVRFASRLGFEIEAETESVIRGQVNRLEGISRERIGEEVRRMLLDRNRSTAAGLLESLGLTECVLGGRCEMQSVDFLNSLDGDRSREDLGVVLAAWALDRGEWQKHVKLSELWRERLMLSNSDRDVMLEVLAIVGRIRSEWTELPVAGQKRLASRDRFDAAVGLVAVRDSRLASMVAATVDHLGLTGLAPEPLIGGRDLIDAGFEAGPRFTEIIDAIYDAQLEGRVSSFHDALEMAHLLWGSA